MPNGFERAKQQRARDKRSMSDPGDVARQTGLAVVPSHKADRVTETNGVVASSNPDASPDGASRPRSALQLTRRLTIVSPAR